ncbi:MAG: YegS/Rv2252/BmrU family lipid kinase [Ruminococcus sp.]|nr:YegS/Rv2252/BmrU family lipid kinase [Ruminococcus sp.]
MKKMLFVYNPRSGRGQIKNNLFDIVNVFTEGGYEVTTYPTLGKDDAYIKICEQALDFDLVTVSGGDGTLSMAVKALMELDEKVPLGYIPSGSTNDVASSLNISKDMVQAAQDIVEGDFFEYDIGQFNDSYFVYIAAFGIFTDTAYETPQNLKNRLGHAAYIVEALRRINTYKGIELTIEHDGVTDSGNFIFGAVSNSRSVAGMKFFLKDKVFFNDGLFEVTLVRTPETAIALQQTLNDALMNQLNTNNFLSFKASKVEFKSTEEVPWTLDGESGGSPTQVTVINRQKAVRLIIKGAEEELPVIESE